MRISKKFYSFMIKIIWTMVNQHNLEFVRTKRKDKAKMWDDMMVWHSSISVKCLKDWSTFLQIEEKILDKTNPGAGAQARAAEGRRRRENIFWLLDKTPLRTDSDRVFIGDSWGQHVCDTRTVQYRLFVLIFTKFVPIEGLLWKLDNAIKPVTCHFLWGHKEQNCLMESLAEN